VFEAIVCGQRKQHRVEADGVAVALEHGALQIVVEKNARDAEGVERGDVTS